MEQRYIDSLTEICGKANVFYEMADIERYLYDETEEYVRPKACEDCIVVRPGTYEEVSEILKWANQELVPIIPRGGGTGACGAAIPTEPSVIMLEQLRTIDKSRLRDKLGSLGEDQMCKLDHALEVSVGLLPIYNTI